MFHVKNSGLPEDPEYPDTLEELGYFINEIDEIRSTTDPTHYYKYFHSRNDRHNERRREAFNTAIRREVDERMGGTGMLRTLLPLGVDLNTFGKRKTDEEMKLTPHIPIWTSPNLGQAGRVCVLFGESREDLAIWAHQIIGLQGGVSKGSAVEFTKWFASLMPDYSDPAELRKRMKEKGKGKAIASGIEVVKSKRASLLSNPEEIDLGDDEEKEGEESEDEEGKYPTWRGPGLILANLGQLRWCKSLGCPITARSWGALQRPSALSAEVFFDAIENTVPGHRTPLEHVGSIFTSVVPKLCKPDVKLQLITLGDAAHHVPQWLDGHWDDMSGNMKVKDRIECLAMMLYDLNHRSLVIKQEFSPDMHTNTAFLHWLRVRARGYYPDIEAKAGSPLFGPEGGAKTWQREAGSNIYAAPDERQLHEKVFPRHYRMFINWIREVVSDPDYEEPEIRTLTLGGDEETPKEIKYHGAEYWDTEDGKAELAWRKEEGDKRRAKFALENPEMAEAARSAPYDISQTIAAAVGDEDDVASEQRQLEEKGDPVTTENVKILEHDTAEPTKADKLAKELEQNDTEKPSTEPTKKPSAVETLTSEIAALDILDKAKFAAKSAVSKLTSPLTATESEPEREVIDLTGNDDEDNDTASISQFSHIAQAPSSVIDLTADSSSVIDLTADSDSEGSLFVPPSPPTRPTVSPSLSTLVEPGTPMPPSSIALPASTSLSSITAESPVTTLRLQMHKTESSTALLSATNVALPPTPAPISSALSKLAERLGHKSPEENPSFAAFAKALNLVSPTAKKENLPYTAGTADKALYVDGVRIKREPGLGLKREMKVDERFEDAEEGGEKEAHSKVPNSSPVTEKSVDDDAAHPAGLSSASTLGFGEGRRPSKLNAAVLPFRPSSSSSQFPASNANSIPFGGRAEYEKWQGGEVETGCPPERMERLPSEVLIKGPPTVSLTKEEMASVLQTSAEGVQSPVKAEVEKSWLEEAN